MASFILDAVIAFNRFDRYNHRSIGSWIFGISDQFDFIEFIILTEERNGRRMISTRNALLLGGRYLIINVEKFRSRIDNGGGKKKNDYVCIRNLSTLRLK